MVIAISGHRIRDRNTVEAGAPIVSAVRATASAVARVPGISGGSVPAGAVPGWLRTTSNTGLAGVGVTTAALTAMSVPTWGGLTPNVTAGTYTRRRITLGGNTLAPGSNTTFVECLIEGPTNLVQVSGANVRFTNCDFVMTAGGNVERVHFNAHPYYGAGAGLVVEGCLFSGGTIFMNLTSVPGSPLVQDCYGYGQDPDNDGGLEHRDGFTCRGGTNITLQRSRFDCNQSATTGALFLQNTYGDGISNLTFIQNSFEGSGYAMTLQDSTALTFTDNRVRSYGSYAYDVVVMSGCTFTSWTNNYRWDSVQTDYKGALIPKPT